MLWGGWLLVTGLVFSFMQGIFHAYYTVALAPAIGALVGMGAVTAVAGPPSTMPRMAVLAATVAVTAWWSYVLLGRSTDFAARGCAWAVLVGGLARGRGAARLDAGCRRGVAGLAARRWRWRPCWPARRRTR